MNNNDIKYCIVVQTLYIYVMFLIVLVIRKEWEKLHVYTRHEL